MIFFHLPIYRCLLLSESLFRGFMQLFYSPSLTLLYVYIYIIYTIFVMHSHLHISSITKKESPMLEEIKRFSHPSNISPMLYLFMYNELCVNHIYSSLETSRKSGPLSQVHFLSLIALHTYCILSGTMIRSASANINTLISN